ncbi:class I SAM-dependent methyltransferase [Olsenella phocaeensis]|uniref:class I SAM-dependent methyltransferase n=2 Tax=Olsenella phocaeensis TaxID=1852385 RepID=UPI003A8EF7B9
MEGEGQTNDRVEREGGVAGLDDHERRVTQAGNPARPEGSFGAQMLRRMNQSHEGLTNWALDFLDLAPDTRALDVGCGGGATMGRLGRRIAAAGDGAMRGHVTGLDYSEVSCEQSRLANAEAIAEGRMDVVCASVAELPFADASFDVVTTVESFYFWPDPEANLCEVARVIRPVGRFLLVADVYLREGLDPDTLANIRRYDLTVLSPEGYEELVLRAGFASCRCHLSDEGWIAVDAVR